MICPKCNQERGCVCTFHEVPGQFKADGTPYKICNFCWEADKIEILKNDPTTRVIRANPVQILERDQQEGQTEEVRDQDVQESPEPGTD